ncbi:MAG: helix-turn-helix transcriptional regulator [Bryobacteraceae bacterium]|nr:helix-turn-helix transcriptional regulator [Bryobacteraceae bacterium]
MSFTQKKVARLLGHRDTSTLSCYESGKTLPPLHAALCLEIVLRVPVAFLFPELYERERSRIRREESP